MNPVKGRDGSRLASVTNVCGSLAELLQVSEATFQGKKCPHTKHLIKWSNI